MLLWNKDQEEDFFIKSLEFASPEQLFYITKDKKILAYWPKNYDKAIKNARKLKINNSDISSNLENWKDAGTAEETNNATNKTTSHN